ncbi:MAG: GNAT family N-acetyltransferase [Hyphomicrobiales bacterium]
MTTVRPLHPGAVPGLYRAWQALRQYNASLDPRIIPTPVSEAEFGIAARELIERPVAAAFIAEDAGEVVGFITGAIEQNQPDRLPERHATIGYLYVEPTRRREGIGRALIDAAREWAAKQEGVSHIEMTVLAQDIDAARFWQAVGFTPFIQRLWAPLEPPGDAE